MKIKSIAYLVIIGLLIVFSIGTDNYGLLLFFTIFLFIAYMILMIWERLKDIFL